MARHRVAGWRSSIRWLAGRVVSQTDLITSPARERALKDRWETPHSVQEIMSSPP